MKYRMVAVNYEGETQAVYNSSQPGGLFAIVVLLFVTILKVDFYMGYLNFLHKNPILKGNGGMDHELL